MSRCTRARDLFGAYWDDETTRAEREWLDVHFVACAGCRSDYEALARTLSAVAALPREEASPDLAERALSIARRAEPAPDRVFARESPRRVPVAAAAGIVLLAAASLVPYLLRTHDGAVAVRGGTTVVEPRLVSMATPSASASRGSAKFGSRLGQTSSGAQVTISDSLFDHSEDVDFVLDPVTLRRGRARPASHLPRGIQGEQAVITF
jgi:hypothetical protein